MKIYFEIRFTMIDAKFFELFSFLYIISLLTHLFIVYQLLSTCALLSTWLSHFRTMLRLLDFTSLVGSLKFQLAGPLDQVMYFVQVTCAIWHPFFIRTRCILPKAIKSYFYSSSSTSILPRTSVFYLCISLWIWGNKC